MLIGYVSDEHHLALPDVAVEVASGDDVIAVAHSTASGAIVADIAPGRYRVTLARRGYGAKHVDADLPATQCFRMLSDELYGYVWPKWTCTGQTAELRIHSTEPYRLDLWRYDLVKEHIRELGWWDEHGPRAMSQLLPDGDISQTGTRWNTHGFTSPAHTPRVIAPERTGLYYVHLHTDTGRFTSFPWVVAPTRPSARVAVLASTNTWNAYNNFGGRSNYINADTLPRTPTVAARLDLRRYAEGNHATHAAPDEHYRLLSFDRPEPACVVPEEALATDSIPGRLQSSLAPSLWRLLAWLSREGFAYDLYSDHQLHTGRLDLDAYAALVLDAHPEYWSRTAYERVKEWVHQRGSRLIYLGGNGIDCEVEFVGDALHFLTQHSPDHESRFHRTVEPAARLLGVTYTPAGEGTGAPYEVLDRDHWAVRDVSATIGVASQHERVPGGASGHETDKRMPHSPANLITLARGANPDAGGAEMSYYTTDSGGAVFAAGSINYVNSLLVDRDLSTVTARVIGRLISDSSPA